MVTIYVDVRKEQKTGKLIVLAIWILELDNNIWI